MDINWNDKKAIFNAITELCNILDPGSNIKGLPLKERWELRNPELSMDDLREIEEKLEDLRVEFYKNAPYEIMMDREFLLQLVNYDGRLYKFVPDELKYDKEFLLALLSKDSWSTYLCRGWQKGEEPIDFFKFAPKELFDDKDFMMQAIKLDSRVIEYASDKVRRDKDVIKLALDSDIWNIKFIPKDVHLERELVLDAVKSYGSLISSIPTEYEDDYEIFIEAIEKDPYAFRNASKKFREDEEVTIELIKSKNVPISLADQGMWKKPHFVLEMCKIYGARILDEVDWELEPFRENYNFAEELIKANPNNYEYLPQLLQKNPKIVRIKEIESEKAFERKKCKTDAEKDLDARWESFVHKLFVLRKMDAEDFQKLFFDTFWYFRNRKDTAVLDAGGWHILSCLSSFRKIPIDFAPSGCKLNEFNAARCLCEDLIDEINSGMPGYYTDDSFVILRDCIPPAGCSDVSAHMSSYEQFQKEFEETVKDFDDYFCDWRAEYYSLRYNMPY